MFVDREQKEANAPHSRESDVGLDSIGKRLLKAAAMIEAKGHWKGGTDGVGGTCAVLALLDCDRNGDLWEEFDKAKERLCRHLGFASDVGQVYCWNDAHSKDEVVATMRAAALGG